MALRTDDFDYALPEELIAQAPLPRRDASRMLVLHRADGRLEHRHITDLPNYLRVNDVLVLNNTRVIPSRMYGRKERTGGRVEVLFLEERGPGEWEVLLKAGSRRPGVGELLTLGSGRMRAALLEELDRGRARLRVESEAPVQAILEEEGLPPLPPYIRREGVDDARGAQDRERYQTVYARQPGAVAAPTAGLHFTDALLTRLAAAGVARAEVTLHVGLGTFRPVTAENVEDHVMEAERFVVSQETVEALARARAAGGRVVAVGSTAVRTLETASGEDGRLEAKEGRTALFIRPPYRFRAVDAILTNFHLPRSTLLMMICAFAGKEAVLAAYREAVRERYRFFSYGDCMLLI